MGLMRRILAAVALIGALSGGAARAQGVEHVKLSLVSAASAVVPGQSIQLAVREQIDPDWHTYWRNPGDAGQKPSLDWSLPPGFKAGDFIWPAPIRLKALTLMDYGYVGEVLLPIMLHAPAGLKAGSTAHFEAMANFLVCKDQCLPQISRISLDLPVAASATPDPQWAGRITQVIAASPKPAPGLSAVFSQDKDAIHLSVSGELVKDAKASVYFYPFDSAAIDHAAPQPALCGEALSMTLKPNATHPETLTELAGVLAIGDKTYEITAKPGAASTSGGPACPTLAEPENDTLAPAAPAPASGGLWPALIGAFLGGLILNLMPCVFPILSMKAASLSRHAHEASKARAQGLLFLVGVLLSFLALGGALLAARAAGAQLGWGFQLQSPPVVAGLCLVMLLVALNMSGLFEIGLSAQGVGSGLSQKEGPLGSLFTGVLAVVVAAPCTAPFMATALGFALTAPPILALAVFLSLGLGFALPFSVAAFVPGMLARLPRPGPWMDIFKKALAFPMYAASAWLLWVLSQQTQSPDLARFLATAVLIAFGAWLIGLGQHRGGRISGVVGLICMVAAFVGAVAIAYPPPARAGIAASGPLPSEPWSQARADELTSQGKVVFVDFTAAWCVTCQVNERAALASAKVAKAFDDSGAVYLRADWTNYDPAITAALAKQGRAGVPLYLVYGKAGGAPQVLPQLLTEGAVIKALKKAAA